MTELLFVLVLGLAGPLLAAGRRLAIPVAVGEIAAGVMFGKSGFKILDSSAPNLTLLAQIGFALVMMVVASHIDIKALLSKKIESIALRNLAIVVVAATALAFAISQFNHNGAHFGTFAVLLASSSAAVILPAIGGSNETRGLQLLVAQVALADLFAVIVLPFTVGTVAPAHVAIAVAVILVLSLAVYFLLRWARNSGKWKALRELSTEHGLGVELRVSLILLLALIVVAQNLGVTLMVAGFGLGLAIAANGLPRRLAKQLFAVSEGFFSPIFFVLLGASVDVTAVFSDWHMLVLALFLGLGAIAVHLLPVAFGFPGRFALASSAQLGIPAAAVSLGLANHSISATEGGAIMLAALMTLAATAIAVTARSK